MNADKKTYRVFGFAMAPVECQIEISAFSEEEAMQRAELIFKECPLIRKSYAVQNSADYSAIFDFRAREANLIPRKEDEPRP